MEDCEVPQMTKFTLNFNIVYGVSNDISQKVRISEFYFTWMGGVIANSSDRWCCTSSAANLPTRKHYETM